MIRRVRFPLIVAAVAVVFAGCTSAPPKLEAKRTVPVTWDAAQPTATIETALLDLVVVSLPRPDQVGYAWQIAQHDPRYLKQMTALTPAAGQDGGQTVSFLVLQMGRTRLRFLLLPVAETREAQAIAQRSVTLTIE